MSMHVLFQMALKVAVRLRRSHQSHQVKALAEAIMQTWESYPTVMTITENARVRARKTHDADENYRVLMRMYQEISKR